jgi:hypothetical protein
VGSNPAGNVSQVDEKTVVTIDDKANTQPENLHLVFSFFSQEEILERLSKLPIEVQQAIVKMIK